MGNETPVSEPSHGPATARERLSAESACRDLVLRSAAHSDAGEATALAALFCVDAELVRPSGQTVVGRAAIERVYRDRAPERITAHLVCGTLFDEIGHDSARATSRVLLWTADARCEPGSHGRPAAPRQVVGTFHDTFAHTHEGWRIAHRRATFDLFLESAEKS